MIDVNLSDRGRSLMQTVRGTACDPLRWRGCTELSACSPSNLSRGKILRGADILGNLRGMAPGKGYGDHRYRTVPSTDGWVYYDISYKKLSICNISF